MANHAGMISQLTANAIRIGWFASLNWALVRAAKGQRTTPPGYRPERPVPTRAQLFADLRKLGAVDAQLVRDGLYPAFRDVNVEAFARGVPQHFRRVRAMFDDLPSTIERRKTKDTQSAKSVLGEEELPDYFAQDFHFQTEGYLSDHSAQIYDIQVETLFYGSAGLMRRAALKPIIEAVRGRDQRRLSLLDVACGTGRFLRDLRLVFPAMKMTGLDLSQAYLDEAKKHIGDLRPVCWLRANAEDLPLPDDCQDIVTTIFLFHELPPEVRRRVAAEMARVLKPGGRLVFVDSLQFGDREGWDGLLEAFPVRFHEPYFRSYAIDGLSEIFSGVGLKEVATRHAFLSKIAVFEKEIISADLPTVA